MAILSEDQLYSYATAAGFTGRARDIIVAIAEGESGGKTDATNFSDPFGGSFGVLQINGSHFTSNGGSTTKKCAFDPLCAFRYGFQLSNGGKDFTPWGAFTNGSYKKFLTTGTTKNIAHDFIIGQIPGTQTTDTQAPGASTNFFASMTSHAFLIIVALVVIVLGFIIMINRGNDGS